MNKILIIVGSVMGTAVEVANILRQELSYLGHEVKINSNFDSSDLNDPKEIILVCTSSTGMGDIPDNISPFYHYLTIKNPTLSDRFYGIVSLGDSSYPNFAEAGNIFDTALDKLGAKKIGETLTLDAILVDDYESEVKAWLKNWSLLI